jgi:DNA-binding LacI/PurR family transcriptional regulator
MCVRIDDYTAALEMTRYLIGLGHERLAFIKGHPNQSASEERWLGFTAALEEAARARHGGRAAPHMEQGFFSFRSGLDAARKLLAAEPAPTAIFASNDDMAAAVIAEAHRRGLDVPRDLTVVGFDDTLIASTIWPELTTIQQPIARMAAEAVDMLVGSVRGGRAGALQQGHSTHPRSGERPRTGSSRSDERADTESAPGFREAGTAQRNARAGGPAATDGQWHGSARSERSLPPAVLSPASLSSPGSRPH